MADEKDPEDRLPVFLFLDESGTAPTDPLTMVGATAYHDVARAEAAIIDAYGRALGDASLWHRSSKRRRFSEVGFHFTEDSESVRNTFLSALDSIDYRAYAAYSRNDAQTQHDRPHCGNVRHVAVKRPCSIPRLQAHCRI
ncbi:hypothetical protein E0H58_35275 [Kribbella speibonae]|uniref:DUF3800 domain-containing protein n=1 Tax=Kribbella speibonae TaxID=1572660 RepID=A0ABY1ZUX4_9ACTN|nr:hypothetical protein E0H58_35275 [Kribbella speibonae]